MMKVIILVLLLSVVGFGQEPITGTGNLPYETGIGTTQEFWVCSTCKGMFNSIKDRIAITCSNYHPKGCCHHWDVPYRMNEGTADITQDNLEGSGAGLILSAAVQLNGDCHTYSESILSTELKDGQLEITKRSACIPSVTNAVICWPTPCDYTIRKVWKEIYTARDGKIVLLKTIEGKIVPAQGERVEWPKE